MPFGSKQANQNKRIYRFSFFKNLDKIMVFNVYQLEMV